MDRALLTAATKNGFGWGFGGSRGRRRTFGRPRCGGHEKIRACHRGLRCSSICAQGRGCLAGAASQSSTRQRQDAALTAPGKGDIAPADDLQLPALDRFVEAQTAFFARDGEDDAANSITLVHARQAGGGACGGGGGGGGRRVMANSGRSSMAMNWLVSAEPTPGNAGSMLARSVLRASGGCQCTSRRLPSGKNHSQSSTNAKAALTSRSICSA